MALDCRSLIRPPWPGAATRDENRGLRGQARLSLVQQSPLRQGRFSFQDEVPGSSPGRPTTTHHRNSERCRQRAGRARCQLGPRWGRTPIPAGTPSGPSGSAHPGGRLGDDHPPWSPTQPRTPATPRVQPPRAAACTRAHRAAARDGRSPGRTCLVARVGKRGRRGPHPTRRPGSATALPLTTATWAASPASRPSRPLIEPSTARQPQGLHPFRWSRSPGHLDLVPTATV